MSETATKDYGRMIEVHTEALTQKKSRVRVTVDFIVEGNPLAVDLKAEIQEALIWATKEATPLGICPDTISYQSFEPKPKRRVRSAKTKLKK